MAINFRILQDEARRLHSGVPYGKGQTMFDQVAGAAGIAEQQGNDPLVALAWLHKCQERKRISAETVPLTDTEIQILLTRANCASAETAEITEALAFLKTAEAAEKAHKKTNPNWERDWALQGPVLARRFLVLEKMRNFQASEAVLVAIAQDPALLTRDSTIKPPRWHSEYCQTRGAVVDAIGQSPELTLLCTDVLALAARVQNSADEVGKMGEVQDALTALAAEKAAERVVTNIMQPALNKARLAYLRAAVDV